MFARKTITPYGEVAPEGELKRALGAFDLTALGIGAIIGTGIFVLAGIGAQKAGPGIMLSFIVAGIACLCAALCYAELAAMIPAAGSAYTYVYATMGEFIAWMIGWNLILEYLVASSAVASGWSGYFNNLIELSHIAIPHALLSNPFSGGIMNLPAFVIALLITALLTVGVQESARVTSAIVILKIIVLLIFIVVAAPAVVPAHWHPFLPFGFQGVMSGAAIIFFAYIGFDAVATTAEEAKNPQRDLPIGILASLAICTVFYIIVAAILTGMVPFAQLNVPDPLAHALVLVNKAPWAKLVSFGAVFGLTSVLVVMMMGMPRIWFAMSRDGLMPAVFSKVHPRFRTPFVSTIFSGIIVALLAGLLPIDVIAEMTNIGTLSAFIAVSIGVWVLRRRSPELPRVFKAPALPFVATVAVLVCGYMALSLANLTKILFVVWVAIGAVVYFTYSVRNSKLHRDGDTPPNGLQGSPLPPT